MNQIVELLRQSPVAYGALSCLDVLLSVAGCALLAVALFRLNPQRQLFWWIACAVLCAACGGVPPQTDETAALLQAAAGLALPFVCLALLFRRPRWKAMLTAAGYVFVEALRFLLLLAVFRFDYNDWDDALTLAVGLPLDLVFFLLALLLLILFAKRHTAQADVTKNGGILFLLIALSVAVFVASLMVLGPSYSQRSQMEFMFLLLNIPVLTATVTFALTWFFRMKNEAEKYKRQLEMQIRQFEWMEQMAEEVRAFRHDLPKKMRPLIAYLDENRPEEARRMAEQFSDYTPGNGERFHTGNYRLDTVLFCEQQLAQREGVRIDVSFDTVFPKEGVAPDDIYTIFPNALDNAIEACRNTAGEKVISFRCHMNKRTVFITIRNPFAGTVKIKNGLPQTGKADKTAHGHGFRSIQKAAAKYGENNVTFTSENGVFELMIFLNYAEPLPGTGQH